MFISTQQLQNMSMEEDKDKYLYKQQELIDALTDEMTVLYSAQETLETQLDRILVLMSNEPDKVEEINRHLQACSRKDELDALSQSMKSWTTNVENMNHELQEIKEMVENDNLIIEVKDNLLEKLKESCDESQSQIKELKSKSNNNCSNANIPINVEKS